MRRSPREFYGVGIHLYDVHLSRHWAGDRFVVPRGLEISRTMVREREQPIASRHRRNIKSATSRAQIGRLEVFVCLAGIAVAVVNGWDFNLLIALGLLAVLYAVLRHMRSLARLKSQHKQAQPSNTQSLLQKVLRGNRLQPPSQKVSLQRRETRKSEESSVRTRPPQHLHPKGRTHESHGFRNA